ncbi:MAG TPA: rod shape-determining protein RodA [Acidimicrobiia bacterium]|nr:rod shape-determining protein RodA [Acidimicrobiia bacterium]
MGAPFLRATRTSTRNPLRHADWVLIGTAVLLALGGLVMVYSSTQHRLELNGLDPYFFVVRQASWIVLGLCAMAVMMWIDYRVMRDMAPVTYVVMLGILFLVLSPLGSTSRGTQAWFGFGSFQLQPSEFTKIVLIVAIASYCYQYRGDIDAWRLAQVLGIAAVPLGLILLQPDLGTSMVIMVVLMGMLLVAGARPRHLGVLSLAGITAVVAIISVGALEEYQVERLTSFINTSSDLQTSRYNLEQSQTAIGAGGLFGKGLFEGTQTSLAFVPEQHTDFIFTAVGEELGFVGGAVVLLLLGVVVWRVWRVAQVAKDPFGTLACVGVMTMIAFQVFQNVGMSMGMMPITGIPLPFVSYGGSSMITSFAAIGLVANIGMRRFT